MLDIDTKFFKGNFPDRVSVEGIHAPGAEINDLIADAGLLGQAAYLQRVTLNNQKLFPLANLTEDVAPYFSIILIYKGAEDWITSLPIDGET